MAIADMRQPPDSLKDVQVIGCFRSPTWKNAGSLGIFNLAADRTAFVGRVRLRPAASINPTALLDELRKAVAVLTDDHLSEPAPIKRRPVLRLIEGGLST